MIFLPKFLYGFRAASVFLTKKLFQTIDFSLSSFPWIGTQLRIARSSLQAPKSDGGLACPNLRNYFIASQLTYVYDWLHSAPPLLSFLLFLASPPLFKMNYTGRLGLDFLNTLLLMWAFWLGKRGDKYSSSHLKGCCHRFPYGITLISWSSVVILTRPGGVALVLPTYIVSSNIFVSSETLKGLHGVDNEFFFKYLCFFMPSGCSLGLWL